MTRGNQVCRHTVTVRYKKTGRVWKPESFLFRGAIHTRQYWLFCITLFCSWIGIGITLAHIVIHATGLGISAVSAASILAIIGGIGILGRITMGGIADRIGNK